MARVIREFKSEIVPCALDADEISGFIPDRESDLNTARSNKFILVIDLPKCFRGLDGKPNVGSCTFFQTQKLLMNVYGKAIPEIEIPSNEIPGWGHVVKASSLSRKAYRPVNIKFVVDSKYENYFVIYKWLDIMNSVKYGGFDAANEIDRSGKLPDYTATFSLYLLNEYNKPVVRWDYGGAFPTGLGSINLDKRDPSEIECEFTFEFSFINMQLL
jgi:hypothetical protein